MRAVLLSALLFACSPSVPEASPEAQGPPDAGAVPRPKVQERVRDAHDRLMRTPGGELIWKGIEAHGGLAAWHTAGTLAFDFDYQPLDAPERRMHTRNEVDLWRARARQTELGDGADATLGWDGTVSWITPGPEAFPTTARFWALTPYYFVGMPFVFADPGTRFEVLRPADVGGRPHDVVKITYEDGTGDSPDDFYVVYLDKETRRMGALRYIVAYPGFYPDGGSGPEKYMRYSEHTTVGPLTLVSHIHTHTWDPATSTVGDVTTDVRISNHALGSAMPGRIFAPPPGVEGTTEITGR